MLQKRIYLGHNRIKNMKYLWKIYLEQSSTLGFRNYLNDRMNIMQSHSIGMTKCFNKNKLNPNKFKRLINTYKCENVVLESTIQKLRNASEKCQNTQFPEKCEEFYNHLIPKLEYKIKFNNSQIDSLNRKAGLTKYD